MQTKEKTKIIAVNEVLSAMLSAHVRASADTDKLQTDAVGYIAENYGVNISSAFVVVVENTDSRVHLALPFYSALQAMNVEVVDDPDVAGGGEIAIGVTAVIATIGGGALMSVAAGLGLAKAGGAWDTDDEK